MEQLLCNSFPLLWWWISKEMTAIMPRTICSEHCVHTTNVTKKLVYFFNSTSNDIKQIYANVLISTPLEIIRKP